MGCILGVSPILISSSVSSLTHSIVDEGLCIPSHFQMRSTLNIGGAADSFINRNREEESLA